MKKKKYLCGIAVLSIAVNCTLLIYNEFITCSTTERAKQECVVKETVISQAVLEEKPTYYVELNNKAEEGISQEAKEGILQETEEGILQETESISQETGEIIPQETEEIISQETEGILQETKSISQETEESISQETEGILQETEDVQKDEKTNPKISVSETGSTQIDLSEDAFEEDSLKTSLESTYMDYDTPPDNSFKSYMDYRTITDTTSKQYELQKQADTDWCGMRMVDDRYCIAVGSYYSTSVGQAIDVIMQNGGIIHCVVADLKQDIHTDSTNRQNPNGSIVEFLVDTDTLHSRIQRTGDISYFDTVWGTSLFAGEIDTIRVFEN